MEKQLVDFTEKVDWDLLFKQKQALVELYANGFPAYGSDIKIMYENILGVIHFLDVIGDLVDDMGIWKNPF